MLTILSDVNSITYATRNDSYVEIMLKMSIEHIEDMPANADDVNVVELR